MIIYSNILTQQHVSEAFAQARSQDDQDIWMCDISSRPSRTHAVAITFYAYSHHGTAASAHGPITSGPRDHLPRAASWDAYGYVIAYLFSADPAARIGPYKDREDFIAQCHKAAPGRKSDALFLDIVCQPGQPCELDVPCMDATAKLDAHAQALGWADNAEMTHQSHAAPAFGCAHCASRLELDALEAALV